MVQLINILSIPIFGAQTEILKPFIAKLHFDIVFILILVIVIPNHLVEGLFTYKQKRLLSISSPHELIFEIKLADTVYKLYKGLIRQ